jgi:beta-ribofuranosylaminobenzene 5'-phosphate synthase
MEIINTREVNPDYILVDDSVSLKVYPRIHMFTFDLSLISGILKHGSLGYSLKNMPIEISVRKSTTNSDVINTVGNVNIKQLDFKIDFDMLRAYTKSTDHYDVTVSIDSSIREHTGLGLSTQILGGIYLCSAKLSQFELKINDLFKMGIGHFSALGLNLLFNPGLIFEMGCKISNENEGVIVNPSLSQEYETVANTVIKIHTFSFYTTVAIPKNESSISGTYEIDFWTASLPDKQEDSYRIVYNVLESIIPGIVENDFNSFIDAINENITLGSKPLEEDVQTMRTKEVLIQLRKNFKFAAVSSLGPALYAFSEHDPKDEVSKLDMTDYTIYVYGPDGQVKKKVNHDETLLIASFACMGKTTFAKQNPDIAIDIESIHYARIYKDKHANDEAAKGNNDWVENKLYPMNYVQDVIDNIGKYKVIFLTAGSDILKELDKKNVKYSILYPGEKRKVQVLEDAKKRGNDADFIQLLDDLLSSDTHRLGFSDLQYEKFEVINDDRYMEQYIADNYYV